MIQIKNNCALKWLKEQSDFSADLIYCDPPYALGSEIIIKPDGKPDYKKAVDFMAKWEMPDGAFWEQFYKEANRVLKHGGHLLMFGIDRQLFLFGYYSNLAGFETKQSLYWYFISNFPKASDLSKMIDKNAGAEREVVGKNPNSRPNQEGKNINTLSGKITISDISKAETDLAKKYDGFKYSIAPLKQVVETIMVFQKPYKTGSCLHDVLAYENGDNECTVGALDIENNRVALNKELERRYDLEKRNSDPSYQIDSTNHQDNYIFKKGHKRNYGQSTIKRMEDGRFPSQAFVTTETAEILDKQSGVLSSGGGDRNSKGKTNLFNGVGDTGLKREYEASQGGASKILHKCDFETADFDLFVYEPKVSASERNAGCENFDKKNVNVNMQQSSKCNKCKKFIRIDYVDRCNCEIPERIENITSSKNNHPTLKPIALNYQITKLFKTPNYQTVLVPFSGAGSELIGLFKAGFENIKGCELNPEYVEISKARVKHHCEDLFNQNVLIE